ncbi:MAG TPA: hypothetical protein DCM05_06955 [Elusimicrobia bacterium]|nr:hypothetical protein [Elusimicrobiota bacterium]
MPGRGRDLALVALFALACALPFLGAAFSMDDAYFLAIARRILASPFDPLGFDYNWLGTLQPVSELNLYPPAVSYLIAPAAGSEWATRALLLPFDLAAAGGLYLLAARFLKRPLLPVLLVLAGPGYLLSMSHPLSEKLIAGFGFPGLWLAVKAADEDRPGLLALSGLFLGAAMFCKPSALFLLAPAAARLLSRRVPWRRAAAWAALCVAPAALLFLMNSGMAANFAELVLQTGSYHPRAVWSKQLRSVLCFAGGCGGAATFLLPQLALRRRSLLALSAAAALALVLPWLDTEPVGAADRAAGWLFAWGALASLAGSGAFWLSWSAAVALLQGFVYWSVVARFMSFMAPPMVFAAAAALEARLEERPLRRLYGGALALTLALSFSLAAVDARSAGAARELASEVRSEYVEKGRRVWFAGHWGLQHYLELAGARALDRSRGGWDEVRPGDVVVAPYLNGDMAKPSKSVLADVRSIRVTHPLPLRLMSGWTGQAGFYSNLWGFLPYALSTEPVEEYTIVEVR